MIETITATFNLLTSNTLRVYYEAEPQYVNIKVLFHLRIDLRRTSCGVAWQMGL